MLKESFVELSEVCFLEKGKTGLMKAVAGKYTLVATGKERRTSDTYQFDTKAVCIPLVSSTGHGHASLKYVHYEEGKFALGTILVAVIPKDENVLNAQFLHLYLSRLKDEILVPLMTGAANVTLTVTKLKKVKIPLPSIEKQRTIVSLFNRMDKEQKELTSEIVSQQTLVKKLRQAILQEAMEGKLTASWRKENTDIESASVLLEKIKAEKEKLIEEKKLKKQKVLEPIGASEIAFEVPDGWVWCRLGEIILNTSGGKSPQCDNVPANINDWGVIKTTAIQSMNFNEKENKVLSKNFQVLEQYIIKDGDLLITRAGPMNRVGIVCEVKKMRKKLILSDKTIRLAYSKDYINATFLQYMLSSDILKKSMKKYMTGMAESQVNISQDNMKNFTAVLAPLQEQKQIVDILQN
jgi:type I restriction enzyme S subunit